MPTRKRTRKTGRLLSAACLTAFLAIALAGAEKKPPPAEAVLAGTVFRDNGFALRGAEVHVTAAPDPAAQPKRKKSRNVEWRAFSDARGEFFLRLPAGPASYNVVVRAQGFEPQQKVVTFAASERLDFHFLMSPGAEKK